MRLAEPDPLLLARAQALAVGLALAAWEGQDVQMPEKARMVWEAHRCPVGVPGSVCRRCGLVRSRPGTCPSCGARLVQVRAVPAARQSRTTQGQACKTDDDKTERGASR